MIETLFYNVLKQNKKLQQELACYKNEPAIFYQMLPHDKAENWKQSFPRMVYNIEWRYHAERKTDGIMAVDIYCTNENKKAPEDIAKEVVAIFEGLFLTEKTDTYCAVWDRTDSFETEETEPVVFGARIYFDVYRFSKQEGVSPCPVWAMNQFIKEYQPNCILLGHDKIKEKQYATAKNPIVFVKKESSKNSKTSYARAWMESTLHISVVSSDIAETQKWITAIYRDIAIEGETIMQNGSPFLVMDLQENMTNAPFMGQIIVTGQYGILRKEPQKTKLNHATFQGRSAKNG